MIHKLLCVCCRQELYHGVTAVGSQLTPRPRGTKFICSSPGSSGKPVSYNGTGRLIQARTRRQDICTNKLGTRWLLVPYCAQGCKPSYEGSS